VDAAPQPLAVAVPVRRDGEHDAGSDDPADQLTDDVETGVRRGDAAPEEHRQRDGGVEVAARDRADDVDQDEQGNPEGQRDADRSDLGGQDRGADAADDQDGGADGLRGDAGGDVHERDCFLLAGRGCAPVGGGPTTSFRPVRRHERHSAGA
jgi:hypothetical protein